MTDEQLEKPHNTNQTTKADHAPSEEDRNLVDFAAIPWESPTVGVSVKQTLRGTHRIRLVEFTEEFIESDWCRKGHIAYVVNGTLEIDFGTRLVTFKAGDGLYIPPAESSKHKARVPHGTATLFIVEVEE